MITLPNRHGVILYCRYLCLVSYWIQLGDSTIGLTFNYYSGIPVNSTDVAASGGSVATAAAAAAAAAAAGS